MLGRRANINGQIENASMNARKTLECGDNGGL
jgi:hypothetical protein